MMDHRLKQAENGERWKNLSINLTEPAWMAIKLKAAKLHVAPGRLVRDVVSLYLGYSIVPGDPLFSAEVLDGELPGIMDEPKGYVRKLDFFRSPAKAMPEPEA
jgi:hypothetical protein